METARPKQVRTVSQGQASAHANSALRSSLNARDPLNRITAEPEPEATGASSAFFQWGETNSARAALPVEVGGFSLRLWRRNQAGLMVPDGGRSRLLAITATGSRLRRMRAETNAPALQRNAWKSLYPSTVECWSGTDIRAEVPPGAHAVAVPV